MDQDDKGTISKGVKKSMFENTLHMLKNKSMFSWCVISSSTLLDDLSQTLVPEKLDQIISNSGEYGIFGIFCVLSPNFKGVYKEQNFIHLVTWLLDLLLLTDKGKVQLTKKTGIFQI